MHDQQATGLGDGSQHRVAIQRRDRAQVDDLDGDPLAGQCGGGLGADVAVQAVGDDGDVVARHGDVGDADRHPPVAVGDEPFHQAVRPLVLEEQHRIGIVDGLAQHACHVGGCRRRHDLEPGHVGVEGLDGLRVVQRSVHAAAPRGAHDERHREVAVGAVVDLGRLAHQLVEGRVDEVGELDLGDGPHTRQRQPDGHTDDARLGQRRVEHARLAELGEQAVGGAEDAAPRAHVLAQHHHPLVGGHEVVEGGPHGLDHVAFDPVDPVDPALRH